MSFLGKLGSWSDSIQSSKGLKRAVWALVSGVLATLTLPPVFLFVFIFPAFTILLLLLASAPGYRRAFLDGWLFGVGFFTTNLYWVTISLFTDIEQFWWLVPLALFGLPVCVAIYTGLMGIVLKWFRPKGANLPFVFAALWTLAELVRGHLFTGFPWNLMGYAWSFSTAAIQTASVVGVYGLSFLAVLFSASPALYFLYPERTRSNIRLLYVLVGMLLVILGYGAVRLEQNPTEYTDKTVHIVQGNIEQTLKWNPAEREKNLKTHVDLSEFDKKAADIVIWPETAFPFYIQPEQDDSDFWKGIIPPGVTLLTGAVRMEGKGGDFKVYNSLIAINHEGKKVAVYDKNHLVPFGEYVPFRHYLPLPKITEGGTDFSTGNGYNVMNVPGIPPLAALICYEAIFPEKAVLVPDIKSGHPQWLLNITNDAWFGISSGPYQHFEMARMRAVEQGLPLVRAANTGISALVDAYGRIILNIELGKMGKISHRLSKPSAQATVYSKYKDALIYIIIFLTLAFCVARSVNKK